MRKFFKFFSGECNPYPLAVFRIAFFSGVILHFFPALLYREENFTPAVMRTMEWSEILYQLFPYMPVWLVTVLAGVTMVACVFGLVGMFPRTSALVSFLGLYTFASFNALNLQTLGIAFVWSIFPLLFIVGGGNEVLSLPWLFGRPERPCGRLLPRLILVQILIAFFFSGLEKVLAGWPFTNEMHLVMNFPPDFLLRDWVRGGGIFQTATFGALLSAATIVIELVIPVLLLVKRTRIAALVIYESFFLGIIAMLEVPPLFWFVFAPAALLVLDSWPRRLTLQSRTSQVDKVGQPA